MVSQKYAQYRFQIFGFIFLFRVFLLNSTVQRGIDDIQRLAL